ncbi:HNH endonuclease [Glutamicibacter sp.]|uniref:HNH endonuclease n=1 Tax=Glutamicibacter sp. TaxID=1931995 RepID=UPI0028BEAD3F|nr:DUF222 domain-containing protein [Glutamicibacter sp.]
MSDWYEVSNEYFEDHDWELGSFEHPPCLDPWDARAMNDALSSEESSDQIEAMQYAQRQIAFWSSIQARLTARIDALSGCTINNHPILRERGTANLIGMARHESQYGLITYVRRMRNLIPDMPYLFHRFENGDLGLKHVMCILAPFDDSKPAARIEFDEYYREHPDLFENAGAVAAGQTVQKYYDEKFDVKRSAEVKSAADRRFMRLTKGKDCFKVNGSLPVEVGVALQELINKAAHAQHRAGDERTMDQLRADIFAAVAARQPVNEPLGVNLHINMVVTDRTLFFRGSEPVVVQGYGSVPADYVRAMLAEMQDDQEPVRKTRGGGAPGGIIIARLNESDAEQRAENSSDLKPQGTGVPTFDAEHDLGNDDLETGTCESHSIEAAAPEPTISQSMRARMNAMPTLRRVYTDPTGQELVAMDSKSRLFSGQLRRLIQMRDPYCRTPYCSNDPKHIDHVKQAARGGETSFDNSGNRCPICNLAKESPGWSEEVTNSTPHEITIRPTSKISFRSVPPPLVGLARLKRILNGEDKALNPIPEKVPQRYELASDEEQDFDFSDDEYWEHDMQASNRLSERIMAGEFDALLSLMD